MASFCDALHREVSRLVTEPAFDELTWEYVALDEPQRIQLRTACIASHQLWHDWWVREPSYVIRFRNRGDPTDLRRSLLMLSLLDGYPDTRDAVMTLSGLREDAHRFGIETDVFDEIAVISSVVDRWDFIGPLGGYMRTNNDP